MHTVALQLASIARPMTGVVNHHGLAATCLSGLGWVQHRPLTACVLHASCTASSGACFIRRMQAHVSVLLALLGLGSMVQICIRTLGCSNRGPALNARNQLSVLFPLQVSHFCVPL